MIAASRRLVLRIYLVSVAQLLAVAGTVALIGWLTFRYEAHGPLESESRYLAAQLAERLDDPRALREELARAMRITGARASVYDGSDRLLASNVSPPLTPRERRDPRPPPVKVLGLGGPPHEPVVLVVPLFGEDRTRGYVVYGRDPPGRAPPSPALWALAVALIGAGIASVGLARSFVKPLSVLAGTAAQLGEGDLTARVRSNRRDELGELARAFDDMADRLTLLLRSQQELLANVSHELRTPLARIRVALDIAAEGDAAAAQEALGEITEDLAELERLVADVLQTAKLDLAAGRAGAALPLLHGTSIPVEAFLENIVQRFRGAHPGRVLTLETRGELPIVRGDPVLLRRAIENLLANARAYSDDHQPIVLRAERAAEQLTLSVEDRGIGIAREDLPHVATPFFRTDKSRARRTGGLGLGLSLARRIAAAHSGQLTIESKLNEGTTVHVTLPIT